MNVLFLLLANASASDTIDELCNKHPGLQTCAARATAEHPYYICKVGLSLEALNWSDAISVTNNPNGEIALAVDGNEVKIVDVNNRAQLAQTVDGTWVYMLKPRQSCTMMVPAQDQWQVTATKVGSNNNGGTIETEVVAWRSGRVQLYATYTQPLGGRGYGKHWVLTPSLFKKP